MVIQRKTVRAFFEGRPVLFQGDLNGGAGFSREEHNVIAGGQIRPLSADRTCTAVHPVFPLAVRSLALNAGGCVCKKLPVRVVCDGIGQQELLGCKRFRADGDCDPGKSRCVLTHCHRLIGIIAQAQHAGSGQEQEQDEEKQEISVFAFMAVQPPVRSMRFLSKAAHCGEQNEQHEKEPRLGGDQITDEDLFRKRDLNKAPHKAVSGIPDQVQRQKRNAKEGATRKLVNIFQEAITHPRKTVQTPHGDHKAGIDLGEEAQQYDVGGHDQLVGDCQKKPHSDMALSGGEIGVVHMYLLGCVMGVLTYLCKQRAVLGQEVLGKRAPAGALFYFLSLRYPTPIRIKSEMRNGRYTKNSLNISASLSNPTVR